MNETATADQNSHVVWQAHNDFVRVSGLGCIRRTSVAAVCKESSGYYIYIGPELRPFSIARHAYEKCCRELIV